MTKELTISSAGAVIRGERSQKGLSLRGLADLAGLDKGLLSKYENDRVALSIPVINRIADALGLRPEVLACKCLSCAYPALARPRTTAARLLSELLDELAKDRR